MDGYSRALVVSRVALLGHRDELQSIAGTKPSPLLEVDPLSSNRQDGGLWSHLSGFESLRRNQIVSGDRTAASTSECHSGHTGSSPVLRSKTFEVQ